MRLRILRSFESRAAAASSNRFLALPAIYQFQEHVVQVKSRSSQLYWLVSAESRSFSIETSLPLRPTQYRAQETRNDNSAAAGKVIFSPSFPEPSAGPLRTNA